MKSMEKEFDNWNNIKKRINVTENYLNFKEREIYYINIGKNIWFEEDGKGNDFLRPAIVLKKFNNYIFWGIPLTSSNLKNKDDYFYYKFYLKNIENCAILSQIRLFDVKRLSHKIGFVSIDDFIEIKKRIKQMLD